MANIRELYACLLLAASFIHLSSQLPETVTIAGLYSTMEKSEQWVFQRAVEAVNADETVLPGVQLEALITEVPHYDTLFTSRTVCQLMGQGIAAVFGPSSPATAGHIQSVCDTMEIPHIQTMYESDPRREKCSINLHPHPRTISSILVRLVEAYHWDHFTIVYQDDDGLVRLQGLLKMYDPKGFTVTVRQLSNTNDMKPVLKQILLEGSTNIVLDCNIDILVEVLKNAQQVGLMGSSYNYIISNLDLQTIDLEQYRYAGTNITGLRIVDPASQSVKEVAGEWASLLVMSNHSNEIMAPFEITMSMGLTWDAVWLFARALQLAEESHDVSIVNLDCEEEKNWEHGFSIINFMRTSEMQGLTGLLKFDNEGLRTDFSLDLIEVTDLADKDQNGVQSIGDVDSRTLNLTRLEKALEMQRKELAGVQNMTFIVQIALSPPYNMRKDSPATLSGNDRYEGYCIDLIKELSQLLGFNYTFVLQPDNVYGSCYPNGTCDGMIKAVVDGEAHLAITDLTITFDRATYVDFTKPFMNLGIALLFRKPYKIPPSTFSFMDPFSIEVWVYLFAAYVLVSIEMYIMARITPDEWRNPYPCIEEPEELENQFSVLNAFWFTIGALMQQGSEIAPIAISTRMAAGMWWFFTLILVSSYTANLAAFLTVEPLESPIKSVEDLTKQKLIKYGAKRGGSTLNFFLESTEGSMWRQMGDQMLEWGDSVITAGNDEGLKKVQDEPYAYFMESTSIRYMQERHCDINQVGSELDQKGYGIAMKKNAEYVSALSAGVVKLQETGKLQELYVRWWEQRRGGGACNTPDTDGGGAKDLGLENVGGVFLVLVIGVGAAVFIAFTELLWVLYRRSKTEGISLKHELIEELKFISKCRGSTKQVKKPETEEDQLEDALNGFEPRSVYASDFPMSGNRTGANHKEPLY